MSRRFLSSLTMAAIAVAIAGHPRAFEPQTIAEAARRDVIADEIARLTAIAGSDKNNSELWTQIKPGSSTALTDAAKALAAGRRLAAIERLAAARSGILAAQYVDAHAAAGRSLAALEAEWGRTGALVREDLATTASSAVGVRPAAVRGLSEAALSQIRGYYEASLEYARSTTPDSGLYYLGSAQAQHDWLAFASAMPAGALLTPPRLRPLGAELEALEARLLAAYRPPASVERHRDFITASATVKEARELDAKGLRYGAMLRYLQATARVALLRQTPAPDAAALLASLTGISNKLGSERVDHSLARLFIEQAQTSIEAATPDAPALRAAVILSDVLPQYLAALEPAAPHPDAPAPRVTITLVRWPFT